MPKGSRERWQCRWSPTLGALEGTHEEVWGTTDYLSDTRPTVFFGMYGLPGWYELWRHKGRRAILWCGTDIQHFRDGYWLDAGGKIHIDPWPLAVWIDKYCESWVENEVERDALLEYGIRAKVCPSFLGDVRSFLITYQYTERPKVYASVSGDNFKQYGWDVVERVAGRVRTIDFYLYGNVGPWRTKHQNVHIRGRIPKEKMNAEISQMQCGLRPLEFDGASEIMVKSILWGQHPISRISYPQVTTYNNDDELVAELKGLHNKREPNREVRRIWRNKLNRFPWNRNQ